MVDSEVSKNRRREHILDMSRKYLAEEAPEQFTIRNLAQSASVTVQTIYNLIGGKDEILSEISKGNRVVLTDRLEAWPKDIIDRIAYPITVFVELLREDEPYYLATHIAQELAIRNEAQTRNVRKTYRQMGGFFCLGTTPCWEKGMMREDIPRPLIEGMIGSSLHMNLVQWGRSSLDLDDFENDSLAKVLLVLASDAKPALRKKLITRVQDLA